MADDAADFSRDALSAALDEVIPPSSARRMPGAGEIGLADAIAEAARANPALRDAIAQGLARLDALARESGADAYANLSAAQRSERFQTVAAEQPGFVPNLVFPLITNYYRHPRVLEALGLEARPPFPKGHAMEPFDERLLDAVRRRPKMYRDC
jgi:hypothetical protein